MCDSNHFTFPELCRWSVLYSEINRVVSVALGKTEPTPVMGGGGGGVKIMEEKNKTKQHLVRICSWLSTVLMDLGRELIC